MKVIKIDGKDVNIMGTPMTAYYYKKEFGQSLSGDLMALEALEKDQSVFDDINFLQMIWALAKTADKNLGSFVNWLQNIESLNLAEIIEDVAEEAMNATFRGLKPNRKSR